MEDRKATNEKVVGEIGAGGVPVKLGGEDSARGDSDNGSYGRNSQHDEHGCGSEVRVHGEGGGEAGCAGLRGAGWGFMN